MKGKRHNEHKYSALRMVYSSGEMSRLRLGRALNIRLATVTEIVRELLKEGLLKETGKIKNPRGRV